MLTRIQCLACLACLAILTATLAPVEADDLSQLESALKAERRRLAKAYVEDAPPDDADSALAETRRLLEQVAAEGSRDAAKLLLAELEEDYRQPDLQLSAFTAQRAALAKVPESSAAFRVLKKKLASGNKDWRQKVDIIYGFRAHEGPDIDAMLLKLTRAKTVFVACAAIRALGARRSVAAMPTLIKLYDKTEGKRGRVWLDVRQSLTSVTGYDYESARDWKKAWRKLDAAGFDREKDRGKAKLYFPRQLIHSQRVVMLLDTSSSMHLRDPPAVAEGEPKPRTSSGGDQTCGICRRNHPGVGLAIERQRLWRGKRAMQGLLLGLRKGAEFNIVHFNERAFSWQNRGQLAEADEGAITTALDYLEGYRPEGLSYAYAGFEKSLRNDEIDTIIYMSDGFASGKKGERVPYLSLLARIRNLNRHRVARIFSVGFRGCHRDFMMRLAGDNGGSYEELD